MQTQKGSVRCKRNHRTPQSRQSSIEERNSCCFVLKSALWPSSREPGCTVLRCITQLVLHSALTGAEECHAAVCTQVQVEAFQAAAFLTVLQLLYHAVDLYITLLSLPRGTAVLQYSYLAKYRTDFFTSKIPTVATVVTTICPALY